MLQPKRLAPGVLVSGQIAPQDVPALAAAGITRIVGNRPDGEEPGQPAQADLRAAVAAVVGLEIVFVPVSGMPGPDLVDALEAVTAAPTAGETLMYCRSGMRSTALWAMSAARSGAMAPDAIIQAAAAAGYDLTGLAPVLHRLAG
jgi:uncharacterized protein (TIGR01244 family)